MEADAADRRGQAGRSRARRRAEGHRGREGGSSPRSSPTVERQLAETTDRARRAGRRRSSRGSMALFEQVARVRKGVAICRRPRATACARSATCGCGRRSSSRCAQNDTHRAVRQLPAHPLLRAAAAAHAAARHDRVVSRRLRDRCVSTLRRIATRAACSPSSRRGRRPWSAVAAAWHAARPAAAGPVASSGRTPSSRRTAPSATTTAPERRPVARRLRRGARGAEPGCDDAEQDHVRHRARHRGCGGTRRRGRRRAERG